MQKRRYAIDIPKKRGTRQQGHESQQHLSVEDEKAVVRWIERVDDMGFLIRLEMVRDMAREPLRSKDKQVNQGHVGEHWANRFLDRHPGIATKMASRLDTQKAVASNPTTVKVFIRLVQQTILCIRYPPRIFGI